MFIIVPILKNRKGFMIGLGKLTIWQRMTTESSDENF
jgi:hypothetical protein